jgi:hypothetical protein
MSVYPWTLRSKVSSNSGAVLFCVLLYLTLVLYYILLAFYVAPFSSRNKVVPHSTLVADIIWSTWRERSSSAQQKDPRILLTEICRACIRISKLYETQSIHRTSQRLSSDGYKVSSSFDSKDRPNASIASSSYTNFFFMLSRTGSASWLDNVELMVRENFSQN